MQVSDTGEMAWSVKHLVHEQEDLSSESQDIHLISVSWCLRSHEVALAGLELAGIDEASTEEAEADRQIPRALVGPPAQLNHLVLSMTKDPISESMVKNG